MSGEDEWATPWYEPNAQPRFVACRHHCRDRDCRDANWMGSDRVHVRSASCPTLRRGYDPACPKCGAETELGVDFARAEGGDPEAAKRLPMSEWAESRRDLMTPQTIAANHRLHMADLKINQDLEGVEVSHDGTTTIDIAPRFDASDVKMVLDNFEVLMKGVTTKQQILYLLVLNACAVYTLKAMTEEGDTT